MALWPVFTHSLFLSLMSHGPFQTLTNPNLLRAPCVLHSKTVNHTLSMTLKPPSSSSTRLYALGVLQFCVTHLFLAATTGPGWWSPHWCSREEIDWVHKGLVWFSFPTWPFTTVVLPSHYPCPSPAEAWSVDGENRNSKSNLFSLCHSPRQRDHYLIPAAWRVMSSVCLCDFG